MRQICHSSLHLCSREARSQRCSAHDRFHEACCCLEQNGALQGVQDQPAAQPETEEDGAAEGGENDDECGAEFKPVVQLSEVETVSGEEAEAVIAD